VDKSVQRFFQQCVQATTACALYKDSSTTQTSLLNQYNTLLTNTMNSDLRSYYKLEGYFFDVLYNPSNWKTFAAYLDGVLNNGQPIGNGPTYMKKRFDPSQQPVNTPQVLNAIACGDVRKRFGATGTDFSNYYSQTKAVSTYGADSYMGNIYSCQAWKIDALEKPSGAFSGIVTGNPILFANGQYDPVTPLVSANASSAGFVGSGVLVSEGAGVSNLTSFHPAR
jgi:hypothetical protein